MQGRTSRKSLISGRPVTTQGSTAWHFYHINFPKSLTMGLAPMLGEAPGSGQPNRQPPRLAGAVQEWCRGHSLPPGTPHRRQKPGFHRPAAPVPPLRPSRRRVLAGGLRPARCRPPAHPTGHPPSHPALRPLLLCDSPTFPTTRSCSTAASGSVPTGTPAGAGRPCR